MATATTALLACSKDGDGHMYEILHAETHATC